MQQKSEAAAGQFNLRFEISNFESLLASLAVSIVLCALPAGCASAVGVSKVEQQTIQENHDKAAAAAAAEKDAAALKLQQLQEKIKQAEANPAGHPIEFMGIVVSKIEPWVIGICILSAIVFLVSFGFQTYLGPLANIGIVWGERVGVVSLALASSLPFLPKGFFVGAGILIVWFVVLLIRDKGDAPEAIEQEESEIKSVVDPGAGSTAAPAPTAAAAATKTPTA